MWIMFMAVFMTVQSRYRMVEVLFLVAGATLCIVDEIKTVATYFPRHMTGVSEA